jgi:hypothetical protein
MAWLAGTAKYEIIGASDQPVLLETLSQIGVEIKHPQSTRSD